jgi:hypothetical protein
MRCWLATGVVFSQARVPSDEAALTDAELVRPQAAKRLNYRPLLGMGTALTLAALAWGIRQLWLLLWLPASLIAEGRSIGLTSALIAKSTVLAIPTIVVATYLYTIWSTKWVLMLAIGITTLGLLAMLVRNNTAVPFLSNPLLSVSLLIVGTSAVISTLVPYAAESFPIRLRGRATGWVAGCSKIGGVKRYLTATRSHLEREEPARAATRSQSSGSRNRIFAAPQKGRRLNRSRSGITSAEPRHPSRAIERCPGTNLASALLRKIGHRPKIFI